MKIEMIDPVKLIPYKNNAKKHPHEQIMNIARQIDSVGFTQPVIVDADNIIIIGHGRTLAAIQLNLPAIPVIVRSDLSAEQVTALRIADNKVAESEWDMDFLKFDLGSLLRVDFDMNLTGFQPHELDELLADVAALDEEDSQESEQKLTLEITFPSSIEMEEVRQELLSRGYIVK